MRMAPRPASTPGMDTGGTAPMVAGTETTDGRHGKEIAGHTLGPPRKTGRGTGTRRIFGGTVSPDGVVLAQALPM